MSITDTGYYQDDSIDQAPTLCPKCKIGFMTKFRREDGIDIYEVNVCGNPPCQYGTSSIDNGYKIESFNYPLCDFEGKPL